MVKELAQEAGFEPEVLDLLKQLGLTSLAELKLRLQVTDDNGDEGAGREPEAAGGEEFVFDTRLRLGFA